MSPNVAWNGSLESYHPYLQPQKVSKITKIECIHCCSLPKNETGRFGPLCPLGVNSMKRGQQLEANWVPILNG
jgi:hypothetical protein